MKKGRNCYRNESVYEYCFRINVRFIFCCWKLFLILVLFLFDFLRMIVLSLYHLNCDFFVRSHPIWINMYLLWILKSFWIKNYALRASCNPHHIFYYFFRNQHVTTNWVAFLYAFFSLTHAYIQWHTIYLQLNWPFASICRFKILAILVWICDLLELFESVFLEFFSNSKKWITHLFTIRDQFIYKLFGHDDLYFHITIFTNGL